MFSVLQAQLEKVFMFICVPGEFIRTVEMVPVPSLTLGLFLYRTPLRRKLQDVFKHLYNSVLVRFSVS